MTEQTERVARAICTCRREATNTCDSASDLHEWVNEMWGEYVPEALAAIEAMQKPTEDTMTLVERLRNPAWQTNSGGGDALLDVKQTREAMDDAADLIGAITALLKFSGQ